MISYLSLCKFQVFLKFREIYAYACAQIFTFFDSYNAHRFRQSTSKGKTSCVCKFWAEIWPNWHSRLVQNQVTIMFLIIEVCITGMLELGGSESPLLLASPDFQTLQHPCITKEDVETFGLLDKLGFQNQIGKKARGFNFGLKYLHSFQYNHFRSWWL